MTKRGRPRKIPGPLQRLPSVIEGTSTNPRKGSEKDDRYIVKKVKQPTTASVFDITLPRQSSKFLIFENSTNNYSTNYK